MLHTRGIVLRTIKYGETSVIADIFTAEKGLCSFIGGGVRAAKSKMAFGLFQPMTVVDLVSYWRDAPGTLHRLKELRAGEVWQAIPFDLRRGAVALFMAEVCRKCIHEGEVNDDLFDDLCRILHHLDTTAEPISHVHLHFLLRMSAHLGFQPEEVEQPELLFFDLKEGIFQSVPPLHPHFFGGEAAQHMLQLLHVEVEHCHEVALTPAQRKQLLAGLLDFFRFHVANFQEINTPEVLAMVMG
jgi:DNA repair protein RecO (recombination protein O)